MMKPILILLITLCALYSYEFSSLPDNKAHLTEVSKNRISVISQFNTEPKNELLDVSFTLPIGLYQSYSLAMTHTFKESGFKGTNIKAAYAINPWKQLSIGGSLGTKL